MTYFRATVSWWDINGMKLIIDPSLAGISGDMFVGALLDLSQKDQSAYKIIESLVAWLQGHDDSYEVEITHSRRKGILGTYIQARTEKEGILTPTEIKELIERYLVSVGASETVSNLCLRAFALILQVEAKIHNCNLSEVHLNETGSVDTIFDICGTGLLLQHLGVLESSWEIHSLLPSVGGGSIQTMHGVLPVPAPATLEILRGERIPFQGGPEDFELVTPTGAALLSVIKPNFQCVLPSLRVSAIGYGCGQKELAKTANVLRIITGDTPGELWENSADANVAILETNLDDVSGEVLGYLMQKVMDVGALDATLIPAITKKNRPTQIIQIIAPIDKQKQILRTLVLQTGTLGVRIHHTHREVAQRSIKTRKIIIQGIERDIRVKYAQFEGNLLSCKPEYEDLRAIAEEFCLPLRVVQEIAQTQLKCEDGTIQDEIDA